jgi:hypothetical protein
MTITIKRGNRLGNRQSNRDDYTSLLDLKFIFTLEVI